MYIEETEYYAVSGEDKNGPHRLILKRLWHTNLNTVVSKYNITELAFGFSGTNQGDISFLKDLPWIQWLSITGERIKDLRPIYSLPNLYALDLGCSPKHEVDFSVFRQLRSFSADWHKRYASIFETETLEDLYINNYPMESFDQFSNFQNLKKIRILSRKLNSLKGLEGLPNLESLSLANCPKLTDLARLNSLPNLQKLEVEGCKNIYDLSPIAALHSLVDLTVADCKKLNSVHFLRGCPGIERLFLFGDNNFKDGDLSPILSLSKLKKFAIGIKRHYTPNRDEIREIMKLDIKEKPWGVTK
jgi:Leucine-rich repeat (LRR) protein